MFRFAALRHPEHADDIGRVLAIPAKRRDQTVVCYLTTPRINALLAAPDRTTWLGRRDHALLALAIQTGLRVSELIALTRNDIHLDTAHTSAADGKGRKHRTTPLTAATATVLRDWLTETIGDGRIRCSHHRGRPLSLDAIAQRLSDHAAALQRRARASRTRTSHPTSCGTPPPWGCCTPGSTPP